MSGSVGRPQAGLFRSARWTRARRRDRRVYLLSHPLLFVLLCLTRRRPVVRLGRTVLVHGTEAYREVLTRVPLDRTAIGTTGGAVTRLTGGGQLFDQDGRDHRAARRRAAAELAGPALDRLRPLWQDALSRRLTPAADRCADLDLVELAEELAGITASALTGSQADPRALARAACAAAATAAREHLPGLRPRRASTTQALTALTGLLPDPGDSILAVAAVNTTVAALPRAAAWCADANGWPDPPDEASQLAVELLRLTAPTPLLPRVAAADATVAGSRIRAGDRLLLIARHAARAHRPTAAPTPATTQAVFGAGPHACPGAALARGQLAVFLAALAPYRPVVRHRVVDRSAALPGYRSLVVRLHAPGSRTVPAEESPCG